MQHIAGRISHVIMACHLENHTAVVERLGAALGIDDWDGPADLEYLGFRHAISFTAGLEVVAPLTAESPLTAQLEANGEGLMGVVFGVQDLESALRRAEENGLPRADPTDGYIIDSLVLNGGKPVYPSFADRFAVFREVVLQPVSGTMLVLGQLESRAVKSD